MKFSDIIWQKWMHSACAGYQEFSIKINFRVTNF